MLTAPFETDVFPRAPFEAADWRPEAGASSASASGSESLAPTASSLQPPACTEKTRRVLDLLADAGGAVDVRAVCINLDRRPDRWEQFQHNCPIAGVERSAAIDGRRCRPPEWWRQGGGAWGCMLSHISILQAALMDGLDQRGGVLLVLEDDALFPPDFAEKAERFLLAVPKDWDQLYFGGQHRGVRARPPQRINGEVIRPYMVNRTQAYAVRGEFMRVLYRHLCDWPDHARHPRHHVDHRMELLHASGRHNVYAPTRWIIGQAGGKSDVSGRMAQDRYWNYHLPDRHERGLPAQAGTQAGRDERAAPDAPWLGADHAVRSALVDAEGAAPQRSLRRRHRRHRHGGPVRFKPAVRKPPVWVIGLHRSGSSVTAGILHRLGVHMGNRLIGYENRGTGGFEAHGLAKICEQAYPFPSTEPAVDREVTKRELRAWLDHRMREAAHRGTIAGGKYPHLCFLVDMLLELEPASRFIHIDRPLEESIRSLTDRSAKARGWLRATPDQCDRLQRALDAAKRAGLARIESLAASVVAARGARSGDPACRSDTESSGAPGPALLTIHYHDLLADPAAHVNRIITFLGLAVRPEQRQGALALVDPQRKQY